MIKRIRVFFIGCPTLDLGAASYLLLAQNAVQREVQFEVCHFWVFGSSEGKREKSRLRDVLDWSGAWVEPLGKWLDRRERASLDYCVAPAFRSTLRRAEWFEICRSAIRSYDTWFKNQLSYNQYDVKDCPTIIITEAPIEGGYISLTNQDVGLISTAKWKEFFKPVSALDYILSATQRLTMRLVFTDRIGSHYPTRGCVWDFDVHQPDARIGILIGHICEACRGRLIEAAGESSFAEIAALVENKWLGSKEQKYSPAAVMADVYKYDLSRSTGLSSGFFSRVRESLVPELAKIVSEGIKWGIVVIITLTMASYFPNGLKRIRSELSDKEQTASSSATPPR